MKEPPRKAAAAKIGRPTRWERADRELVACRKAIVTVVAIPSITVGVPFGVRNPDSNGGDIVTIWLRQATSRELAPLVLMDAEFVGHSD